MKIYLKNRSGLLVVLILNVLLLIGCSNQEDVDSDLEVRNLRCEFLSAPRGVEQRHPYLSWEIYVPDKASIVQSSYRILLYESDEPPNDGTWPLWNSGKIKSGESTNVKYDGVALKSAGKYYWRVQIEDAEGNKSKFSNWASFETGILDEKDCFSDLVPGPDPGSQKL